MIIEILNTQTEAADAQLLDYLELAFAQGSGLALKSDLLGLIPRQQLLHCIHEPAELAGGDVRGCSAAEIDKFRLPAANERFLRVKRQLLDCGVEVTLNLAGVFVRVDLKVAE